MRGRQVHRPGRHRRAACDRVAEREPGAELVWNPEFLREGHAVQDTLHPDRLVYGFREGAAASVPPEALDEVYAATLADGTPKIETDLATAELVKVAANSFLAHQDLLHQRDGGALRSHGADVTMLADAIGHDPRIGRSSSTPESASAAAACPRTSALHGPAGELGADQALSFLSEVDSINMRRRVRMVDLAREVCGGSIVGRRVGVLGAAFKPHSDDIRDSPGAPWPHRCSSRAPRSGHRSEGHRQRPQEVARAGLRRHRRGGRTRRRGRCCC